MGQKKRTAGQGLKLLLIRDYLYNEASKEHPKNATQIQEFLKEHPEMFDEIEQKLRGEFMDNPIEMPMDTSIDSDDDDTELDDDDEFEL